jgi:hypothetical protein
MENQIAGDGMHANSVFIDEQARAIEAMANL